MGGKGSNGGGGDNTVKGILVLNVTPNLKITSQTTATVTLQNSNNITSPVAVTLTSSEPSVLSVGSGYQCNLTSTKTTCSIPITANSYGNTTLSASASGYTASTGNVAVSAGYAYLTLADVGTDIESMSLNFCGIESNGSLTNCTAQHPYGLTVWKPQDITYATVNGVQYAYVTDSKNATLYQCSIANNGTLLQCTEQTPSSVSSWSPNGIAFTTINGQQYAYVTDGSNDTVYSCGVNASGNLTSCHAQTTADAWNKPDALSILQAGSKQYAYVVNNNDIFANSFIYRCTVDTDGSLIACIPQTIDENISYFNSIAFQSVNGTQYFSRFPQS